MNSTGLIYLLSLRHGGAVSEALPKGARGTDTLRERLTDYESIERWWEIIFSAYLLVSIQATYFQFRC
ncbi:hypothetical protein [Scytonema sp. PRP1]|uniref:hypothetical protein n=1 Tax=Scytonema sp. PRP1 TaxID=3120513 RepID=UPI00300CA862